MHVFGRPRCNGELGLPLNETTFYGTGVSWCVSFLKVSVPTLPISTQEIDEVPRPRKPLGQWALRLGVEGSGAQ